MNDGIRATPLHPRTPTTWHLASIITFALLTTTLAQRKDFFVPPNALSRNRLFSWSTEGPLARAINELTPDAIPHMVLLNRHITRIEAAVLDSLRREPRFASSIVQPCNPSIGTRYRASVFRVFGNLGWLEPAWECGSDVSGVRMGTEEPGYTLDDLYIAIFSHGAGIKRRVHEVANRLIRNFTRAEMPFNFTYSTVSSHCSLTQVCVYRQGPHWHQGVGIHSHGRDDYVPDGNRNSILEFFRVLDNGTLGDHMMLRLPVHNDGTFERVILDNTTTMIQTWGRSPNPSCFRKVPVEDNPAILEALERVDHSAQQAEDAVTKSNLAILVLPLGLNLIPIALFADVSTGIMLLYTLMSDVLTVIPLAIKGAELIIIGRNRYRSVVTRVLSPGFMNLTIPLAAGGEIWGAECRVRDEAGRTGLVLLIVSVVFLFVGIGGELVARWFVQKRKSGGWGLLKEGSLVGEGSLEESLDRLCVTSSVSNLDIGSCSVEERYSFDDNNDYGKKGRF